MPEFSVIIPAFNEEKTVETAISETRRVFQVLGKSCEIIVVDDGSSDGTVAIVENLLQSSPDMSSYGLTGGTYLRSISHPTNQGKGAAVKTGVSAAQGEWVVFLDSDLATHPSEIKKALPHLGSSDIIIGSRRVAGADIAERQPMHRHWLGRLFNLGVRTYLGLPFHDTQCGFKLFSRRALPLFTNLQTRGWAFDVELLYLAKQRGLSVQEIPVVWRNGRESRVKISHVLRILREIFLIKNRPPTSTASRS
ncbi:glycosyltransferase family 2 protein [Candidatus Uhrbacteria bacterium]|nr:glycosyltransferase family 2 protein [Candidatus Uhrbacteria bacterium]